MAAQKRNRGPAFAAPKPGEKSTLGVRVPPMLKERLNRAALANDRSLSQEAELRLDQSFREEVHLEQALELMYGRQFAGMLTVLGDVMKSAGEMAGFASTHTRDGMVDWPSDAFAFDQAATAARMVLEGLRPEGDPQVLREARTPASADQRSIGADIATRELTFLSGTPATNERLDAVPDSQVGERERRRRRVRALLGQLAKQIKVPELRDGDDPVATTSTTRAKR